MTRWCRSAVGFVLILHTAGLAAERPARRLVEVTSESTAASQSVLITATAPVAYTTRQLDPMTVLVTLRDVAAGDVASRLRPAPGAPVAGIDVRDSVDDQGHPAAQVRIGLRAPTVYEVRSKQRTIQVRFVRPATSAPAPVGGATTSRLRDDRPASAILSVGTAVEPHAVSVSLRGDGVLSPARIHEAEHPPPRLIIDFAHLAIEADALTSVEIDPVKQVRVAPNSAELTRAVFDLMRPAGYEIDELQRNAGLLRVVFPRDRAVDPVARSIGADPRAEHAAVRPVEPPIPARTSTGPSWAGAALARPESSHVPPRVWAELAGLGGPVAAALDPASAPVPRLAPPDLAPPVVEAALRVPPASAVAAEVAMAAPAPATAPSATSPVPASRRTEPFLPLAGSGRPTGASAPPAAVQLLAQPAPEQQRYTGDPISMDFQGSDLRAVLRVFADISGLNLVIDESVQGEVNVALTEVPWDQAFDIILRTNNLDYEVDGTVIRIASVPTLQAEAEARASLVQAQANAGELVVLTRTLSYARAEDLAPLITSTTLSPNGQVFTDPRTNTLIIRDLEDRLTAVTSLLDTLDRAQPQVEIAARIVQATHTSARALGIQWGMTGRVAQEIGNTLPLSFPNRGGITGRVGGDGGQGPSGIDSRALPDENAATVVNLGIPGASSAVGLTMGAVNGALNLDIVLSALESQGEARILSNPRVITQNNMEAEIVQGDQIPYQTISNNTVTTQLVDAALTLRVTPQITSAGTVIMQIELANDFANFGDQQPNSPPPIKTQRATTTVQVADGDTTVIGGIYESQQTQSTARTPILHRIPLLGWLFRNNSESEISEELLIFLTPRIVPQ